MTKTIALVPIDLQQSRLGLPSMLLRDLAGRSVIERTLSRLARVNAVEEIVLVHPEPQAIAAAVALGGHGKPVKTFPFDPAVHRDPLHAARIAGRKWAIASWRGGLGASTCYDELLPAGPLAAAMRHHQAEAALLVGGDWCLLDPLLCDGVIARHLEAPQAMKMVFTQAPPGLCGVAAACDLVEHMAEKHAGFGHLFGYVPTKPQPDPIGLDVCVQIPPEVRSSANRFIADTPRALAMLEEVARRLGSRIDHADIAAVCTAAARCEMADDFLPPQVTLELTPRRDVSGPITPHHYTQFDRQPIAFDVACRIFEEIGEAGDVMLMLGGLGDALLHPQWFEIVQAARRSGVFAIGLETDLLVDLATLKRLLQAPLDVLSVRLNADTAALYQRVMGADRFAQVTGSLQWLLTERQRRLSGDAALPWIVPRMVKTKDTLADMETFFDRWTHFTGHAVIEPAVTGRSGALPIAPAMSPVAMAPPRRIPCRQVQRRMTILSDATVTLCDQDWQGGEILGDASITPLMDIWRAGRGHREKHAGGGWHSMAMCAGCEEWHRP